MVNNNEATFGNALTSVWRSTIKALGLVEKAVDVADTSLNTVHNVVKVGEGTSSIYLKKSNLQQEAELRQLESELASL